MGVGFVLLLLFLVGQRLSELVLSNRHERWLRAQGAVEVGQSHYPYIVALHTLFFVVLTAEVIGLRRTPASWWWISFLVLVIAEALRYWTISTLGRRWTTRILVLPGAALITGGPFRFIRHPNYLAVALEFLTVPLIFQAYIAATVITVLNLVAMSIRIPVEEKALGG